ncbi:MAG TPA: DinB family protein [Gemmatimonadaceae bacterium]
MAEMRQKVSELFLYMDKTRGALLELARGMNPSFAAIRPKSGEWSAAENLEHLALVEATIVRVMTRSIAEAREKGIGADVSEDSFMASLDHFRVPEPLTKLTAPPTIAPDRGKPVEESLASLEATRAQIKQLIADNSDIALGEIYRAHPALKDLNMFQWALFIAQHEERHRRQMERALDEVTERAAECAPIV